MALMHEYRTRLISDVVSGELDMRHLGPDIDDEKMREYDDPELDEECGEDR